MATHADNSSPPNLLRRLGKATPSIRPVGVVKAVIRGWDEHDVLTYATAVAFQVFFALIPLLLFALGVLGALNLETLWRQEVAPQIRGQVSPPVFQVLDDTVRQILGERHVFWATAGAVFAVWKVSAAVRATTGALNRIYESPENRSVIPRYAISIALALAATVLVLFAVGIIRFGAPVVGELGIPALVNSIGRWGLGIAALLAVVALLGRYAPAKQRPWSWVSFGALVSVGGWIVMSALFGWYLTTIAHYGSLFGNLATLFIVLEYFYLSAVVGLTGLLVDSLARQELDGKG